MRIRRLRMQGFKSIRNMVLEDLEDALILVGKNSTGKTVVLDAIRAVCGMYQIQEDDFRDEAAQIRIELEMELSQEDLEALHHGGAVSRYRGFESWLKDFSKKLPSYQDGRLSFQYIADRQGSVRYTDGIRRNNPYIREVFPPVYYIDTQRDLEQFQRELLLWMEDDLIRQMRSGCCMFDSAKKCNHCFDCMGLIQKKSIEELNAFEAARVLDYKLYQLNLDDFSRRLNENFHLNGGQETILYSMNRNVEQMLSVTAEMKSPGNLQARPIEKLAKGMRSVYMLSLLETYAQSENRNPGIIMVEEPELFLHPQMQKVAGEILYRLSKKNQVIFSTHSPHLLSNFNTRQIRQMVLDDGCSNIRAHTDISRILEDLGYTAGDLLNVDFVFIVEGKQDRSRLPILLNKYYSEIVDEKGKLLRITIINTNSCTNIKTYANLKYINQMYLKDQFLMIRDSDGKDPERLKRQLCRYYEDRSREDSGSLPRVKPENVLILPYYSFENYFLNPSIMTQIGVIASEEEFYRRFLAKWREYLNRIQSGRHLKTVIGHDLRSVEDVKRHMEEIKVYMRGHNLFDLFYGRYRGQESAILTSYVEAAPREEFKDILDPIDRFIYFENRRR